MNDKLLANPTDCAKIFCYFHSANNHFFEIGKDQAFLAPHDELKHHQMAKSNHKIAFLCVFYGLNRSSEN